MGDHVISPEARDSRQQLLRSATCVAAVALAYWAGLLNVPNAWMFAPYKSALLNVCYAMIGLSFLLYSVSNTALRWTIIPIGAVFVYLAALVGQHVVMMTFEPQRWIYLLTHRPLQSVASSFLVALFLGAWLGGAIVGAIILVSCRGLVALERR